MAWRSTTLQQDFESSIEMGAIPGTLFDMETVYVLDTHPETDSIVGQVWVCLYLLLLEHIKTLKQYTKIKTRKTARK